MNSSTKPPNGRTPSPPTGEIVVHPRKGLLERQAKTASRVAAFDELHKQLAVATEVFLSLGDGGREGVYATTEALLEYLKGQGIPDAALWPLIPVQTAIVDADRGTASRLFTPSRTRKGGKPPVSDMQRAFDGQKAIVMECCVEHFRNAKSRPYIRPAAQLAAKLINDSDWPVRVSARELEELRERISQSPKKSIDRAFVDAALKTATLKARPLEWAKALLNSDWVNPPSKNSA
ncbi:MAG: hypothetical protein ACKVOS_01965 [Sphingorhabdus sp.]|uniref:hypothetical protein n=1 Tax=Sphingorhabdus sp. TaxID=1902408 RepID=UPI0038FCB9BF